MNTTVRVRPPEKATRTADDSPQRFHMSTSAQAAFRRRRRVIRRRRFNARAHKTGRVLGWIGGIGALTAVIAVELAGFR